VYDSALNLIVSVQSPSHTDPSPSVISSDGAVLYHTNDFVYGSLLMRSDATNGVLLDGIRLPWGPGYLVVSPDGKDLIVANISSTTTFKIAVIALP
jgi:DNA-binding beta-propeller fold protein YncE